MKKVLIALFALGLTSGSFAQDSTNGMSNMSQMHTMQNADGVIMKNGKVLQRRAGQVAVLTQNLVLADGTTVMPAGTVKMKDGTTITMQEGDYFKMDGTKGNVKTDQNSMSGKMQTDTAK
ncbi:hypothetical protein FW778_22120 [Ginsengibacter hankyongi]|uniref:DUF6799 domain-containing protein n=1 Tax=Ginsengibacter hankyongi TaxID=2607284 RepID=A0A5J5IBJ2_9BACT|nr:DUF6799 domain-containing protein [Ginsengibacter hankyongi]KAA9034535.1 hypothetical protein FW778_22120 [Ginsengibacter hankyongi]